MVDQCGFVWRHYRPFITLCPISTVVNFALQVSGLKYLASCLDHLDARKHADTKLCFPDDV